MGKALTKMEKVFVFFLNPHSQMIVRIQSLEGKPHTLFITIKWERQQCVEVNARQKKQKKPGYHDLIAC